MRRHFLLGALIVGHNAVADAFDVSTSACAAESCPNSIILALEASGAINGTRCADFQETEYEVQCGVLTHNGAACCPNCCKSRPSNHAAMICFSDSRSS